jgi:hypothetical protein
MLFLFKLQSPLYRNGLLVAGTIALSIVCAIVPAKATQSPLLPDQTSREVDQGEYPPTLIGIPLEDLIPNQFETEPSNQDFENSIPGASPIESPVIPIPKSTPAPSSKQEVPTE